MNYRILPGDIVTVNFHNVAITLTMRGLVVDTPHPPTDPHWVIKCQITGAIHYVSEPCTITKTANPPRDPGVKGDL